MGIMHNSNVCFYIINTDYYWGFLQPPQQQIRFCLLEMMLVCLWSNSVEVNMC